MSTRELAEIVSMLARHAEKRLAPPPLRILLRRSSSSLLTPLSAGGIGAAAALTPSSMVGGSFPPCANNHVEDCAQCREACEDCKTEEPKIQHSVGIVKE